MRIRYNSPVVLTYAVAAVLVLVADQFFDGEVSRNYFAVLPSFDPGSVLSYFRMISHAIGHQDATHLLANFSLILLIGPILEEKYGSLALLGMMFVTSLATGILNVLFIPTGLMGASGVAFMMILLSSFTNIRAREIPLTFILVVLIYLAREVVTAFSTDSISQFAHIAGGVFGSSFGFLIGREPMAPAVIQSIDEQPYLPPGPADS
jgi:membrane associated rhomboid family serine protease